MVSSAPRVLPSRRNCTPATPTLSAALAARLMEAETFAASSGEVTVTVGAVVSGVGVPTGVFMSVWISVRVRARL